MERDLKRKDEKRKFGENKESNDKLNKRKRNTIKNFIVQEMAAFTILRYSYIFIASSIKDYMLKSFWKLTIFTENDLQILLKFRKIIRITK